jgi:xylan 1,4-beta-xylosidase
LKIKSSRLRVRTFNREFLYIRVPKKCTHITGLSPLDDPVPHIFASSLYINLCKMYNLSITTGKIADGFSALLMLCCILMVQSCTAPVQTTASLSSDNGDGTYTNPVINADYPDPDIIRVGEDFYMVSSSFVAMPGIPICHSKDLINWRIIGHAYDSITFRPQYRMENEQTAYSRLCWAPSIKYHDGTYYIGVNIADDGFVMFKSNNPEGPYSMHKFDKRLYDPGFFIDDDGKKYVTHGKTKIYLTRLKNDGTGVLDPNDEGTLIITAPKGYEYLFEGCHTYKRNGWYYIFNPALGYNGVQMISRSRNLYGPYETKVLIDDDINYADAGVHQGGYVETLEGESWAYTFQDRDYMGRCVMLYPMKWEEDWPVVGPEGKPGKGVVTYRKPAVKAKQEITFPQHSDDFSSSKLAHVWEFNHVPRKDKWSLTDRPGYFRIYAQYAKGFEWARNSLTQKVSGPYSTGTVSLDLTGLREGDFAGNGIMGRVMYQLGVRKKADGFWLEMRQGGREGETVVDSLPVKTDKIYLRTEVTKQGSLLFYYSLDNLEYNRLGPEGVSNFWGFLGIRHALCCYNLNKGATGGYADFDYFELESNRRGNHYDAFTEIDFSQYDDREGMKLVRPVAKRPMQFISGVRDGNWLVFNNMCFKQNPQKVTIELQAETPGTVIEIREGSLDGKLIATCPINQNQTPGEWEKQTFEVSGAVKDKSKIYFLFRGQSQGLAIKNFIFY